MSRRLCAVVLAGVFAMMSVPSSVRAESQAGGLPVVSDRVKVLEGIAVTLQTAVTTLQSNVTNLLTNVTTLQTKVTTLETKNTGLQGALDAEIAARKAAEAHLQDLLDIESFIRKAEDSSLKTSVASLASQINTRGKTFSTTVNDTFLVNGDGRVGELQLPAGSYFVLAKANLENSKHDAFWTCVLQTDDLQKGFLFDSAQVDTESVGLSFNVNHQQGVMTGLVTLFVPATLLLDCHTGKSASNVREVKIIAISVAAPDN